MTEKELLYFEDGISHEQNICAYLEDMITKLNNSKLIEFMEKEIKIHDMIQSKLIAKLEECSNE